MKVDMIPYAALKPLLFALPAETAHNLAAMLLGSAGALPFTLAPYRKRHFVTTPRLTQELFGRTFANPVGLAAGFDKNATMVRAIHALGFGFTEIGTVTPRPQPGNPRPRMFRHKAEKSLQNAMGFNNDGMDLVRERLSELFPYMTPIGVNIGKNKTTADADAIRDYVQLIRELHTLGDYLVINISSPNTPGLRDLQNEAFIGELFGQAGELTQKPVLLKLAPDMEAAQAVELASLAVEKGAAGIIATNTTVDYSLVAHPEAIGGLSGAVLKQKSFELFEALAKALYGKTTLISAGGIDSAEEAYRRIRAGASLVQIYTALIFEGPGLIKRVNTGLDRLIEADGFASITDAIGADRR